MPRNRIKTHPILNIVDRESISFYWQDKLISTYPGETISAALIANGIKIFGHHPKDKAPLGIFCANGQCSQCMVILDGKPAKACMTLASPGVHVYPADGLPSLPDENLPSGAQYSETHKLEVPVLIIGGGPAGLSAAIELGKLGVETLLIDDKHRLGGKLVLQTHRFFGSTEAVYAGTRGIDIATVLSEKVRSYESVEVWLQSTALAVYEDKCVGIWKEGNSYVLVRPDMLLTATGARERSLAFRGNTLPGIYGAGAFQTLVNRDLVKPADKLFIVGGGNVGLIAGYHALQAGIDVVGLVEAMPSCGGYKVHRDKLARLGVPIYTSHTILGANGTDAVDSVHIIKLDKQFKSIKGTEKEFQCDCVLIAVGLDPVDEFTKKAEEVGLPVYAAGDAQEIAEASAAIFSGKIKGNEIAQGLGFSLPEIPDEWFEFEKILKSKPGETFKVELPVTKAEVFPVLHCTQEIPCDPCSTVCPKGLIHVDEKDIRHLPKFCPEDPKDCIACERCVAICPGLAVTLVDFRQDPTYPTVSIPYEFSRDRINEGDEIIVTDVDGKSLARLPVTKIKQIAAFSGTLIIRVKAPVAIAVKIAGIHLPAPEKNNIVDERNTTRIDNETYICRCEHVKAEDIRSLIQKGIRDINQIKAITNASMGACGGKTCLHLIQNIYREEGIPFEEISETTKRPVFVEVPLETLAGSRQNKDENNGC